MEQKKEDIFDRMMHLHLFRIFEPFYQKNKEMLLYLLFGGLTTIVSIGSYAWVNVGLGINELIANIISWIFAVTFAYVTNKIWVFRSKITGFFDVCREMTSACQNSRCQNSRQYHCSFFHLIVPLYLSSAHWRHRCRSGRIKHTLCIKEILQEFRIVIHTVSV